MVRSRSGRVRSVYSCAEAAGELAFGVLVEFGLLEDLAEFVGEVLVDDLELGDPVLVVERDGGAVLDGVTEVVDRDVVAELLAGQLLAVDERRAGEAHERGVGQRLAHVEGERVVLAAVGLVGDDDDVGPVGQDRHGRLAGVLVEPELVDQREHVPVVGGEQLTEVLGVLGVDLGGIGDGAGVGELAVELEVELGAVGDHHERPRPGDAAEHLLGEPQHRQALAGALRVPEHAEALLAGGPDPVEVLDGGVDAEVLVVAGDDLDRPARPFHVGDEVLDQVEQLVLRARPPDGGLEGDDAPVAVGVDDLPVAEELPRRERRADLGLGPVRQQHEPVGHEQRGDDVAVVAEVVVVGVLDRDVRRLELEQHQRDAVDVEDRVGPTVVELAGDADLRRRQPLVLVGMAEVDEPDGVVLVVAVVVAPRRPVAVTQQVVDGLVGPHPIHLRPVLDELGQRLLPHQLRHRRIEVPDRIPEPMDEHDIGGRVPPQRPRRPERLLRRADDRPPELGQQIERRLLDHRQLVERIRHQTPAFSTTASRSRSETSIWPVTSFGRSRSRMPRASVERSHQKPRRSRMRRARRRRIEAAICCSAAGDGATSVNARGRPVSMPWLPSRPRLTASQRRVVGCAATSDRLERRRPHDDSTQVSGRADQVARPTVRRAAVCRSRD